jgi:hypothetical protein
VYVFGVGEIKFQAGSAFILDYFEAVGVLGNVAVEKVAVDVEEIVEELSVGLVPIAAEGLALLQASEAVTALADERVDCQSVDFIFFKGFIVNSDGLVTDAVHGFQGGVPGETNT